MKTTEKILLVGFLGGLAYYAARKVIALRNLVITPGRFTDLGFAGTTPVGTFTILAQNTSSASVSLDSFAANVFCNNVLVGNVFGFLPVVIPGNSQQEIPVNIQLRSISLVNDIIKAYSQNNFTQPVQVMGFANVMGIQVPINLNFTLGQGLPI